MGGDVDVAVGGSWGFSVNSDQNAYGAVTMQMDIDPVQIDLFLRSGYRHTSDSGNHWSKGVTYMNAGAAVHFD